MVTPGLLQRLTCLLVLLNAPAALGSRSFTIDYNGNTFLKDGAPFRYISGSLHYSRVPSYYWEDRLTKMHAAGLNAVQTYVPWNFHEPFPGVYDFNGDHNLAKFLETAQQAGLVVILRAGPYICGEWEMGGLPSWLLRNTSVVLRSSDQYYLSRVDTWLAMLLGVVKPLLYENGGPVIMVQVENEYGSYYTCDKPYLEHLTATFRAHLGNTAVLFTTDGAGDNYLKCGTIPSLYATVDFGITSNPAGYFKAQRDYEPKGPLVNSEFYTGWLDHWGEPHHRTDGQQFADSLDKVLQLNASVNMYMFEGGTNFGFWNGANSGSNYSPQPTSYDYDAPLSEAGDPTPKFTLIHDVIKKYAPVPSKIPPATQKVAYGRVNMTSYSNLLDSSAIVTKTATGDDPMTFEEMEQDYGFIRYTSNTVSLAASSPILTLSELHDRASIYWNGQLQGVLIRTSGVAGNLSININASASVSGKFVILVENMGRVNYGSYINDRKGILDGVFLNGAKLTGWTTESIPMNNTDKLQFVDINGHTPAKSAVFFKGSFSTSGDTPHDTFLNVESWTKGVAFVNGFNLGRYWPVKGPQKTLYVPASVLKPHPAMNELVLFEIDQAPAQLYYATFVDTPDIG